VEILGDVHVVEADQSVEILFFYLDVAEFPHLHHQLHFLLVSKSLVNKDVLDVLSL